MNIKITLNVEDTKVPFFLELLQSFQDFISIESSSEGQHLGETHKTILDERLAAYRNAPDALLDWKQLEKELAAKL